MNLDAGLFELLRVTFIGGLVGLAIGMPIGLWRKHKTGKFWPEKSAKPQSLAVFYWCILFFGVSGVMSFLAKKPYVGGFFIVVTAVCIGDLIAYKISRYPQNS